jgi:glutamate-1-semialdehyde aminotransferase
MKFENSMKIYQEAIEVIPMGTSTFSRNPNLFVIGNSPLFVKSAKGCRIYDADDNEFIDYSMSLSMVTLGYANSEVNQAAKEGIDEGLIYTLSCPEESFLARQIRRVVTCAEMVRFFKNGSDSCEGAVKLARNYSGKLKIITVGGYHGFHDWFMASTPRNKGLPEKLSELVINCRYNDIESIEKTIVEQSHEIAALIMEPIINYEPEAGFLERIRELTAQNRIVLIYDEMKTGFRLDIGGAQQYFKITPDLAVFGKGLSNGFPLSALAGKKYLMEQFEDENCFMSGSYATEKASLKAALKTIEILQKGEAIRHIWEMGEMLREGIEEIISKQALSEVLRIVGLAPMTHLIISDQEDATVNEIKSFIQQECAKKGVLFVGYHHTSLGHTREDIEYTLEVYNDVFSRMRKALADKTLKDKTEGRVISAFGVRG